MSHGREIDEDSAEAADAQIVTHFQDRSLTVLYASVCKNLEEHHANFWRCHFFARPVVQVVLQIAVTRAKLQLFENSLILLDLERIIHIKSVLNI